MLGKTLALAVMLWMCGSQDESQSTTRQLAATTRDGLSITFDQLDQALGNALLRLRAEEHAIRIQKLREMLAQQLFEREAHRRGLSRRDLEQQEVDEKLGPVTDADIHTLVQGMTRSGEVALREKTTGISNETVRKQAREILMTRRRHARRAEYDKELMHRAGARVLLEGPRVAVSVGGDPIRGHASAPITIVQFSDFQCPYSARVEETLKELLVRYPKQVKVVYKDYPLTSHQHAMLAAQAARCAGLQQRYWEMRERLFANQSDLSFASIAKDAERIGLNDELFRTCLRNGRFETVVRSNKADGDRLGIVATPTFFINGRYLAGSLPLETFEEEIADELLRIGPP